MVTNHDDSGLYRHPTTTRGFIETVNWNVKRAKASVSWRMCDERDCLWGRFPGRPACGTMPHYFE